MRHKIVLSGVIVLLICFAASGLYFRPRSILRGGEASIHRISYEGGSITDDEVCQQVEEILTRYQCRASLSRAGSYQLEHVEIEIDGTRGGRPLHIVLGKEDFLYESAGGVMYTILDGDELSKEIGQLMEDASAE